MYSRGTLLHLQEAHASRTSPSPVTSPTHDSRDIDLPPLQRVTPTNDPPPQDVPAGSTSQDASDDILDANGLLVLHSLFGSDKDLDEILADDNNDDNADNDGYMSGRNDDTYDDMGDDGTAVENSDDDNGDGDSHGRAANADDTIDGDDVNGTDDELTTDSQPQVSQPLFSSLDPSMSQATLPESSDFGLMRTPRRMRGSHFLVSRLVLYPPIRA